MSKAVKGMITDELRQRYGELDSALWVDFVGVDGLTTNEFRAELNKNDMKIELVKRSLFRRAVADTPLAPLGEHIKGPAAIITGGESLTQVAKLIEDWLPKIDGLEMRAAVLEGEYVDESRIEQLAKMPTKRDLQAKIAGVIMSPGAKLAGAIAGPGATIAACIKTIIGKLEEGETIEKVA